MSIEEILDDMEQLLEKAGSVPFAQHKAIIDGERLAELINDIRLNLPQEIKHAKMVAFDRDRIIKEAEAKAEQIVRQAEDRAKVIVSEEAIVREAKNRAVEAVTKAKADCDELRAQANCKPKLAVQKLNFIDSQEYRPANYWSVFFFDHLLLMHLHSLWIISNVLLPYSQDNCCMI